MIKIPLLALAAIALSGPTWAQTPAAPSPPPRARGPALAPATLAAQAAVADCAARHYNVVAMIVDSAGVPVVLLDDGAALASLDSVKSKIAVVMKYRKSTGEVLAMSKADPKLAAELKADPAIGSARRGGVPLMSGGEFIGAFAVSGAKNGLEDDCIQAALAKYPLK